MQKVNSKTYLIGLLYSDDLGDHDEGRAILINSNTSKFQGAGSIGWGEYVVQKGTRKVTMENGFEQSLPVYYESSKCAQITRNAYQAERKKTELNEKLQKQKEETCKKTSEFKRLCAQCKKDALGGSCGDVVKKDLPGLLKGCGLPTDDYSHLDVVQANCYPKRGE